MNYHNITYDDMKNGDGIRVVLWVAGCDHGCKNCQNPVTWDPDGGIPFRADDCIELFNAVNKEYISGITLSGGDPFHKKNRSAIKALISLFKEVFPEKTIWAYTGYTWEEVLECDDLADAIGMIDVLVDGKYIDHLREVNYPWAGSTNQRVIDVKESLRKKEVVIHESH